MEHWPITDDAEKCWLTKDRCVRMFVATKKEEVLFFFSQNNSIFLKSKCHYKVHISTQSSVSSSILYQFDICINSN